MSADELDPPDADTVAHALLSEGDMIGLLRPSMVGLARRLGLQFEFDVPANAHSYLENCRVIHLTPCTNKESLVEQVRHELGHLGLDEFGFPRRRQEFFADTVGINLEMPSYGVHKLVRRHGFSPQMFIQFYRNVAPPSAIIKRAAYLSGTPVILHSNAAGRLAFSETQEGRYELDLPPKEERKLIRRVRDSGQWEIGEFGVVAYPWRLGLQKGVAITFDLRRSFSRVVYGYRAAE